MRSESQLYSKPDTQKGSQTHVIIIGVSEYPHLPGGEGLQTKYPEGLSQLSSPSSSARDIVNWFLAGNFDSPERPLGTVSLLLSDRETQLLTLPDGEEVNVPIANSANAKTAIEDWFAKCNENEDNLGLFFYSGHGLASGDVTSLLLSDYGKERFDPLAGAIDLKKLQNGLETCLAANIIWFIDACRTESPIVSNRSHVGISPIMADPRRRGDIGANRMHVYYSTLQGDMAYSKKGKPSEFTNVLLKAFGGYAADASGEEWWVDTGKLAEVIQRFARSWYRDRAIVQVPEMGRQSHFKICRVSLDPNTTTAHVTTKDRQVWLNARLQCFHEDSEIHAVETGELIAAGRTMWEIEVKPATYGFKATALETLDEKGRIIRRYIDLPYGFVEL